MDSFFILYYQIANYYLFFQFRMSQQIIIEMDKIYPFGQIKFISSDFKIYVRKILKYNSANRDSFKQKFLKVKKLNNISLIKLVKVLEEDNQFHLLYEYVADGLENKRTKSKQEIQNIKVKLIYLSSFLYFNNINTKFNIDDIGTNEEGEIKFYLDIEFDSIQNNQQSIKNRYIREVKYICQILQINLERNKYFKKTKDNSTLKYQNQIKYDPNRINTRFIKPDLVSKTFQPKTLKLSNLQPNLKDSRKEERSREKSIISHKSNALQILTNIEKNIDRLRGNVKKISISQNDKLNLSKKDSEEKSRIKIYQKKRQYDKDFERESVRERWKKQKIDQRKYSSDVNYISQFLKKSSIPEVQTPKSVRTQKEPKIHFLQKISETEEENRRKQSQKTQNMERKSNELKKIPKTKKDFQQLKEEQFKNFQQCKQHYIQQFFGILDDQKSIKNNNSNHTTKTPTSSLTLEVSIENFPKNDENIIRSCRPSLLTKKSQQKQYKQYFKQTPTNSPKNSSISKLNNIQHDEKKYNSKNIQLKKRISDAILKSDQALLNYRKISVNKELSNKK